MDASNEFLKIAILDYINHVAEQLRGFAIFIYERDKMSKKARVHCFSMFLAVFDDIYRNFDIIFRPILKRLLNTTAADLETNAESYYSEFVELLRNIVCISVFDPIIKSLNLLRTTIFNNYACLFIKLKYSEIGKYVSITETGTAVNMILCLKASNEYKMAAKIGMVKKLIWRMDTWLSIYIS